jgi:hypothetical protein
MFNTYLLHVVQTGVGAELYYRHYNFCVPLSFSISDSYGL